MAKISQKITVVEELTQKLHKENISVMSYKMFWANSFTTAILWPKLATKITVVEELTQKTHT